VNQLVDRIAAQGGAASIDVDQAALRVTLDVIGLVSHSVVVYRCLKAWFTSQCGRVPST
jgi:hypothetical protein